MEIQGKSCVCPLCKSLLTNKLGACLGSRIKVFCHYCEQFVNLTNFKLTIKGTKKVEKIVFICAKCKEVIDETGPYVSSPLTGLYWHLDCVDMTEPKPVKAGFNRGDFSLEDIFGKILS
jgi:hypothetical protein